MYHHLLVPVAYEPDRPFRPALTVARKLAAPGARLTLLHVIEEAPAFAIDYLPDGWREDLRRAIEADLAAQLAVIDNGQVIVSEGNPGRVILDWARDNEVDCIVMPSHRMGVQDMLLGSTSSRVVRDAGCAVHVLR